MRAHARLITLAYADLRLSQSFKLFLWAALVFFGYGSNQQLTTAMIVNVLQLGVCIHLKPMGGESAPLLNALEIATLVLTTYINFGALNINAALVSKELATLQGRSSDALVFDTRVLQIQTTMQESAVRVAMERHSALTLP